MGLVSPILLTLKRIMQFELLYAGSLDFFFLMLAKNLKSSNNTVCVCKTRLVCGLDLPRSSIHAL